MYSALGALKTGLDLMLKEEGVKVDAMLGHGGYFKTRGVGQQIAADAINAPVSVMETAGEGGAWGIAVLAAFMAGKKEGETLPAYLSQVIFKEQKAETLYPIAENVAGFDKFMKLYHDGLNMEKEAAEIFG